MLCDAKTRVDNPLVGAVALVAVFFFPPPQPAKAIVSVITATAERPNFFKLQAPNYRKTEDLCAK